jgi:hypothetical protein
LYLTPVAAALITIFFDRQLQQGHVQRAIAVAAVTLATSAAAIANLISGTHPFKRNSVVPYQAIFDFIDRNANGSALAPRPIPSCHGSCAGLKTAAPVIFSTCDDVWNRAAATIRFS